MKLLARLTLAAALSVGAVAAQADPVTATQYVALQASASSSSTMTAGFGTVHRVAGEFIDTFIFTGLSGPALVNASLTAIASSSKLDIDFISALINGVTYTFTRSAMAGYANGYEYASLLNTTLTGPLVLTVHGYAGGNLAAGTAISASYSGTINAKLPEPASLALAAAGLLGVVAVRRRKAQADKA